MTDIADCVVIGAGAVGLAVARALAMTGQDVVILESAETFGTGTSSRNSEVIHAGMYYVAGSLKARFCVRGNRLLRDFVTSHGVPHRMVGKLIVATNDAEEERLQGVVERARANQVAELTPISGRAACEMEPALRCTSALWSPGTGIFDAHAYMLALLADAEAHGAVLAVKSPVLGGEATPQGILLRVGGEQPTTLLARRVVNAAGLGAVRLGAAIQGQRPDTVPPLHLCKGDYFVVTGRQPFQRLIYPSPVDIWLGVHYTMDMGGQGRFGPDVQWTDHEHYDVDESQAGHFYTAIRRYWPGLADGGLQPGYCGIRPKIYGKGETPRDFMIQGHEEHGVPGLVHLYGIESPGLTSSLAIAETVAEMLR